MEGVWVVVCWGVDLLGNRRRQTNRTQVEDGREQGRAGEPRQAGGWGARREQRPLPAALAFGYAQQYCGSALAERNTAHTRRPGAGSSGSGSGNSSGSSSGHMRPAQQPQPTAAQCYHHTPEAGSPGACLSRGRSAAPRWEGAEGPAMLAGPPPCWGSGAAAGRCACEAVPQSPAATRTPPPSLSPPQSRCAGRALTLPACNSRQAAVAGGGGRRRWPQRRLANRLGGADCE